MKNTFKSSFAFIAILALIIKSETAVASAVTALHTCTNILLPSLFPFFVLSKYFVKSGGAIIAGRIFAPFMNFFFRTNGNGGTAFFLGMLSGYPIGAKTAADLYDEGMLTKDETDRLICFCNNSGPLFIIGAVGMGMLTSKAIGITLYVTHVTASITLGIILRFICKPEDFSSPPKRTLSQTGTFTDAVEESVFALLNVFAYVIFFAVILGTAGTFKIFSSIKGESEAILCSVFEITLGIKKLSALNESLSLKLPLVAFMLGWGGLSIHLQTKSVLSSFDFSFGKYLKFKLLHGAIAMLYTSLAVFLIPIDEYAFSNTFHLMSLSYTPHFSHLITSIILLVYITQLLRSKCNNRHSVQKQK